MKSTAWIILPIVILIASGIVLYPNFAERELELFINPEFHSLSKETKEKYLQNFGEKWKKDYNNNGSLSISVEPTLQNLPSNNLIIVRGRFITSAKINQISQENSKLFLESKNRLRPTEIENFLRGGKLMTIKLGLDLQGGMRVVMKGDFESYAEKLRDIYSKEISELETTINTPSKTEDEKKKAKNRLNEINEYFTLNDSRKLIELEKAKLIIDNRLTTQNLTEPQVRIQKDQDSIEVSLPGVANSSQILEILQNTETVEYRLEEPRTENSFEAAIERNEQELVNKGKREDTEIIQLQNLVNSRQGKNSIDDFLEKMEARYKIPKDKYKLYTYWARGSKPNSPLIPRRFVVLERAIALSGNDLTNARPSFNSNNYGWTVSFSLTAMGAEKFFDITSKNKGRNLAIVWGDKVISNPTINEPIAGGHAEISGSFNQEDAIQLSNVISEGALPIPLSVLEMRFIGPTLGIESIEVGLKSVVIGFLLVMIYMLFYYKLVGIVADIALLANVIIMVGLLTLMDFTLTLPGFAGVILTVGMAVDANVIIYERIKGEIRAGKPISIAVTHGFENAFWTIFDSNITTLISGILMIRLGNGPIKGFAITLCWGIITSMFTSLLLSRLLLDILVNKIGVKKLSIGFKMLEGKND
ncbi:MAG: protein translocase subunit SecD [Leptospiraceae bacterium]|nr:protein translocase subunit SecD [Leptospiraceae bacterium]MCK6379772.1 protein translocase subunit SecD [Leptospiraceae bacterium]NUM41232.1 protein translocase subunit SecD [Leptospiraceae bacterium]